MDKGAIWYWRLRGKDAKNAYVEYCPDGKLYTEGNGIENHVPFLASLEPPLRHAGLATSTAPLTQNCIDLDNDSLLYDIYFGINENPDFVPQNVDVTNYQVDLPTNSIYYW